MLPLLQINMWTRPAGSWSFSEKKEKNKRKKKSLASIKESGYFIFFLSKVEYF